MHGQVSLVRACNWAVTWTSEPSFYKHIGPLVYLNPMNLITMRQLCRLCGVSDEFWHTVATPIEASNLCKSATLLPVVA